jgi:hypothetical protein
MELPSGRETVIDTQETAIPIAWRSDRVLIVARGEYGHLRLDFLEIDTGRRQLFTVLPALVSPEVHQTMPVMLSADLKSFAYSWLDKSENLFDVNGWSSASVQQE